MEDDGSDHSESLLPPPAEPNVKRRQSLGRHDALHVSRTVYLFAACAAWNSIILGFDFGVSTLSVLMVQKTLSLSNAQISAYMASLDLFAMVGSALASLINDRFGRRGCFYATSFGFIFGDLIQAAAQSYATLMVGRAILGVSIGFGLAIDPMYIAEISPENVRGYLVSWSECAINVGLVFGMASGLIFYNTPSNVAWRFMYGTGAVLPLVMLCLITCCMPESPRYLLQKGRDEEAHRILARLYPHQEHNVEVLAQEIKEAMANEEAANDLSWSFLLCRPTPAYRRMLVAGVVAGISQQVVGISAVGAFSVYVLDANGVTDRFWQALTLMGIYIMKTLVTILSSWLLLDSWGRRKVSFLSIGGIIISLLILAFNAHISSSSSAALATTGLLLYMIFFGVGMGPVAWLMPSEVFSTKIRAKGVSIATFSNRTISTIYASSFLLVSDAVSWSGAFLGLVLMCTIMFALFYAFVPETKGKTLEDMVVFFAELTDDRSILDCQDNNVTAASNSAASADEEIEGSTSGSNSIIV